MDIGYPLLGRARIVESWATLIVAGDCKCVVAIFP
jgi:hypothetical protein